MDKTKDELRSSQLKDPVIGYILCVKEKDEKPEASEVKGQSLVCRCLAQLWECLEVINGMLWRHYEDDQGEVLGSNLMSLNLSEKKYFKSFVLESLVVTWVRRKPFSS